MKNNTAKKAIVKTVATKTKAKNDAKLLTFANVCESLNISQKVARAKCRRANARNNAKLYDAPTKTWLSVRENSDEHKLIIQILRGTAKK